MSKHNVRTYIGYVIYIILFLVGASTGGGPGPWPPGPPKSGPGILTLTLSLTFDLSAPKHVTSRISFHVPSLKTSGSLVFELCCAADKQIDRQTNKQTNRQTDSNILVFSPPTPTDRVGVGNKLIKTQLGRKQLYKTNKSVCNMCPKIAIFIHYVKSYTGTKDKIQ